MDYQDRVVNFKLMLNYILKYWKGLILVMVVSALAGVGIGYIKYKSKLQSSQTSQKEPALLKKEMSELYKSLSEDEQDRVDYLIELNDKLTEIENYFRSDILMKADPYKVPTIYSHYGLTLDKNAYESDLEKISITNQLRKAYDNYINNGKLASDLMKVYADMDLEEGSLNELFESEYDSDALGDTSFMVIIKNLEEVPDLDENINKLLVEYSQELEQKIAVHEISLIDSSRTVLRDVDLADLQEKTRARYDNTKNSIRLAKTNNEISGDALSYYEYMIDEDGYHLKAAVSNTGAVSKKKIIIKYAILVMVAGTICGLLALALYYLLFVFSKYIVSKDDYPIFNLKYIGDLSNDYQMSIIVSKVSKYCSNNNINRIAIVSTVLSKVSDDGLNRLKSELNQKGIEVVVINEENMDSDHIDQLLEMNDCLLLEKLNSTKIDSLDKLVKLCNDSGINIAGVVNAV